MFAGSNRPAGSGLFNNNNNSGGSSLFGNNNNNSGGGLFGGGNNNSGGGGLFGSGGGGFGTGGGGGGGGGLFGARSAAPVAAAKPFMGEKLRDVEGKTVVEKHTVTYSAKDTAISDARRRYRNKSEGSSGGATTRPQWSSKKLGNLNAVLSLAEEENDDATHKQKDSGVSVLLKMRNDNEESAAAAPATTDSEDASLSPFGRSDGASPKIVGLVPPTFEMTKNMASAPLPTVGSRAQFAEGRACPPVSLGARDVALAQHIRAERFNTGEYDGRNSRRYDDRRDDSRRCRDEHRGSRRNRLDDAFDRYTARSDVCRNASRSRSRSPRRRGERY